MTRLIIACLLLASLLLACLLIAGCKNGVGDRCQVQSDCAKPLVCTHTGTCQPTGGDMFDAEVPQQIDGGIDAPGDAPSDAPLGG